MTNGRPPIESFSAVEKKRAYVGYAAIELTTTSPSITNGRSFARRAVTAVASPQGPPPTIMRSASCCATPGESGYGSSGGFHRSFDTDNLIATSTDADV